jgi:hypothetical protein
MPLVLPKRPADRRFVNSLVLNATLSGSDADVALSAAAAPEQVRRPLLELASPLPVYTASAKYLHSGQFLTKSKRTAWQYLVFNDESPVAVIEVKRMGFWRRLTVTRRYPSSTARRLADAVGKAEEFAGRDEFELRLLRFPDALLHAVWLYSQEESRLSVQSGPRILEDGVWITEAVLVKTLQGLALQPSGLTDESQRRVASPGGPPSP